MWLSKYRGREEGGRGEEGEAGGRGVQKVRNVNSTVVTFDGGRLVLPGRQGSTVLYLGAVSVRLHACHGSYMPAPLCQKR